MELFIITRHINELKLPKQNEKAREIITHTDETLK